MMKRCLTHKVRDWVLDRAANDSSGVQTQQAVAAFKTSTQFVSAIMSKLVKNGLLEVSETGAHGRLTYIATDAGQAWGNEHVRVKRYDARPLCQAYGLVGWVVRNDRAVTFGGEA